MELSKIEKETIILFNEAEPTAHITTANRALRRKLEKLCSETPLITRIREDENFGEYICPRKWIRVNKTRSKAGTETIRSGET